MRSCPQCSAECAAGHRFCPACGFPIGALRTAAGDPLIGRTLGGAYVVLENVGAGGMGKVYRAEQTSLGKTLAIKVIHPHLISDESATARFYTEARASSRLNHPNSVSVLDFGRTDDGLLYLVMEFLRGKDLAHVLWEEGPMSATRAIGIMRQTLAALADAHDLGIIHRDIKPENILIEPLRTGGDFAKVVDFGLAKVRSDVAPSVTMPGIVCGTPDYMAPEQGRGDVLDARSDLYSCGVVLFQLLTGRLPFEADSPTQMVLMHMTEPAPDPRSILATIPDAVAEVVSKSLSKDAKDRYSSAVEFADALAVSLRPVEAPRSSAPAPRGPACTSCGVPLQLNVKFCGECGARVATPSPGPNVATPNTRAATVATTSPAVPPTPAGPRTSIPFRSRVSLTPGPTVTQSEPRELALVGRDAEFEQLDQARVRTERGRMVVLRVQGEPGVGKHRLMTAFGEKVRARGDRFVTVGPDRTWAGIAHWPVARAVRELLGLSVDDDVMKWLDAEPTARGIERAARCGFEELFTRDGPVRLEGRARSEAVVRALLFALTHAAEGLAGRSLVLVFEQLERIDTASAAVLTALASRTVALPVLLIGTHTVRSDPRWAQGEAVALRGLPTDRALAALASVLSTPTPEATAAIEQAGADVLPLYIDQVARWTIEGGGPPPARLVDLVGARFDRLPPRARRAVQALALMGEATASLLSRALGEDFDSLTSASTRLHGWTVIERDAQGAEHFLLSHALLREVVEASIPSAARRELHERCAEVLSDDSVPVEARAMHAEHADDTFQALILLERLGDRASLRGDDLGAALVLRRGLERARRELGRGEIDDPERAIAIFARKLGDALVRAGEAAEAEGVLREALELLSWTNVEWAKLQGALARALYARGRTPEAMKAIDEAVKAARRLGARAAAVELLIARAELEMSLGNAGEAAVHLRGADDLLREALRVSAQSARSSGQRSNSLPSIADEATLRRSRCDVLIRLARALRIAGDEMAAGEPLLEAREITDALLLGNDRVRCDVESAERAEQLGDRRAAVTAWRRAAEGARDAGDALAEAQYSDRETRLGVDVAQSAGA